MSKMKHKETRIKWKNADFYLLYTIAFAGIALFLSDIRSAGSRAQFQTDTPHSERHSGLKRTLEKILHRML